MVAHYVYRMDDVTAGMDRERFRAFLDLFRRHRLRPLLGIVPDNRDPGLNPHPQDPGFWDAMRELRSRGEAEFAQHGHTHVYIGRRPGILGRRYGFSDNSEFVGLPYEHQRRKIEEGRELLRTQGIETDVWMAPSHGFDQTTLRALREAGFGAVTDGIALYPYRRGGLVFVPQQLWAPKRVPLGVWTICLHTNTADERLYRAVEAHLASRPRIVPFSEARAMAGVWWGAAINPPFRLAYRAHILHHRLRGVWPGADLA